MATAESWLVGILSAAAWGGGAYVAVKYVIPKVREMLGDVLKYQKAVYALSALLVIWIYVIAAKGAVGRLVGINEKPVTYLAAVNPVFDMLEALVPFVKWLVIGIAIVVVVERFRLK